MNTTTLLLKTWESCMKRMRRTFGQLTEENKTYRLNPSTASAGYTMLHIAESQLTLAHMLLKIGDPIDTQAEFGKNDEGMEVSLSRISALLESSDRLMTDYIRDLPPEKWGEEHESMFGKLTNADSVIFMTQHSIYHQGQVGQAIKKGSKAFS